MDTTIKEDDFFMQAAITEAGKALEKGEVPIGAVVVCNGTIVGRGHNMVETLSDATAHAEMQAITAAAASIGGKYLNQCTLYVTVEPCVMCAGASAWSQIGRIVYGTADPKRGYSYLANNILHPKTQVTKGIMEDDCAQMVTQFFAKLRR